MQYFLFRSHSVNHLVATRSNPVEAFRRGGKKRSQILLRVTRSFFCIWTVVIAFGCSERFSKDRRKNSEFGVELVEVEPFIYRAKISFPDDGEYVVTKRNLVDKSSEKVIAKSTNDEFLDKELQSGHSYEYKIGTDDGSGFRANYEKIITIPLDIVSSLESSFPDASISDQTKKEGFQYYEVRNLVLYKDKPLATHGRNLYLKVKNLYSDYGTIVSFPENSSANVGVNGRSGGKLIILAEKAQGILNFVMRGQNGGVGAEPPPLGEEGRGLPGAQGTSGSEVVICADDPSGICSTECIEEPGDGSKGHPGKVGKDGAKGMPGGDSGRVFIEFNQGSDFQVKVTKIAGKGGPGSLGGRGGFGGHGGPSGKLETSFHDGDPEDSDEYCIGGNDGPQGDEGPRGNNGPWGVDGKTETSCYRENQEQEWICAI